MLKYFHFTNFRGIIFKLAHYRTLLLPNLLFSMRIQRYGKQRGALTNFWRLQFNFTFTLQPPPDNAAQWIMEWHNAFSKKWAYRFRYEVFEVQQKTQFQHLLQCIKQSRESHIELLQFNHKSIVIKNPIHLFEVSQLDQGVDFSILNHNTIDFV